MIRLPWRRRTPSELEQLIRIQAERNRALQQRVLTLQESNASMAKCIRHLASECERSNDVVELYLAMVGAVDE